MKRSLAIILLILADYVTSGQSYQIGHISVTFVDSSRSNRSIPTEIYYPADVSGDNVAYASSMSKTPLIAFGHGFVMTYDAYFNIRDLVVPKGYIMVFPTTEGSFSPNHSEFGKDLAFVIKAVANLGNSSASLLYGKVDTFNCVMGHSMGGGSSFLALSYDPKIKSIVTFAAAETSPSAISAAAAIRSKALVFAGLNDCVTPPISNQQPMYSALLSDCKHYIGIKGGSHCQMAKSNAACSFGEASCTPTPAISRTTQHDIIDRFLVPWLNYTLKSACADGRSFDSTVLSDTTITFLKNCTLCSTSGASSLNVPQMKIFPNPSNHYLHFEDIPESYSHLSIMSLTGKILYDIDVDSKSKISIDISGYPNGTYLYRVSGRKGSSVNGVFHVLK